MQHQAADGDLHALSHSVMASRAGQVADALSILRHLSTNTSTNSISSVLLRAPGCIPEVHASVTSKMLTSCARVYRPGRVLEWPAWSVKIFVEGKLDLPHAKVSLEVHAYSLSLLQVPISAG